MTRYLPILLLAAAPSPAPVIEEPDLIAEMREDAQDGRTTNKTVLDYIDSLRSRLVEHCACIHKNGVIQSECLLHAELRGRAEQAESALAKAGAAPHQNADKEKV
jgi:hypothetical protein